MGTLFEQDGHPFVRAGVVKEAAVVVKRPRVRPASGTPSSTCVYA